jgi:hypothetical protein
MIGQNKIPIWIGSIFWKDLKDKAFSMLPVEEALNKALQLSDFGTGLQSIHFVPVAIRPTNQIHEEFMTYSGRKKQLIIQTRLNYEQVVNTPVEQFPHLVALTFYQFIDRYKKHRIKDFDVEGFKKAVKKVFEDNGWLQKAELQ